MIGNDERRVLVGMPRSAQCPHRAPKSKQPFHSGSAESHQDPRLNNVDLLGQVGKTGLHFVRGWRPISARGAGRVRPALQNVCDINMFATETHRGNDSREKLASSADKWFSLRIFVRPGRFADEHQLGVGIANTENRLLPGGRQMRAPRAIGDAFPDFFELFSFARLSRSSGLKNGRERDARAVRNALGIAADLFERCYDKIKAAMKLHRARFCEVLREQAIAFIMER